MPSAVRWPRLFATCVAASALCATLASCQSRPRTTAAAASLPSHDASTSASTSTSAGPTIDGCPLLPADNIWNTRVDQLPVSPMSATYLASMGGGANLHPTFGHDLSDGFRITTVPLGTKWIHPTVTYSDESDHGSYPIPANAQIEGDDDAHVLLLDARRCLEYEFFAVHRTPDGGWQVAAATKFDLTSNALRPDGFTSADAGGLQILPGLVRYDEVASGEIRHALRFTASKTQKAHLWPARHDASHNTDTNLPPMGLRLRLRADFDISRFPPQDQVILRALQRYGMILADNGSPIFLSGVADSRWNDDVLHQLTHVTARDFEAVDTSSWQMLEGSGRVDPVELESASKH